MTSITSGATAYGHMWLSTSSVTLWAGVCHAMGWSVATPGRVQGMSAATILAGMNDANILKVRVSAMRGSVSCV